MKSFDQNISQLLNNDANNHRPNQQTESRLNQAMLSKSSMASVRQNSMLDFFVMLFSTRHWAPKIAFASICLLVWCFPPSKIQKSDNLIIADSISKYNTDTLNNMKINLLSEDSICNITF